MMRLRLTALMAGTLALAAAALAAETRTITDATGRQIEVPADPRRVFAAGPPAATLLYALKPDAMVGWPRAPGAEDLPFLRPETRDLPALGRLTGKGDTVNLEILLSARPDLIVDYGTVTATYRDLARRVQAQTGTPYALIDGSLPTIPATLRTLGDLLAEPERGETLAAYAEATFAGIDAILAAIPEDRRPSVYLARGPEGIETAARGSINAEIIDRLGGRNVVEAGPDGLATVSPEQVQAWAPEVIVTIDADFAAHVGAMPEWQGIPAVRDGRVYLAPSAPFGFIDSPPSVNRLIGLKLLADKLYPEEARIDIEAEVARFYTLFYGVTPDRAALDGLLGAGHPGE
ncbi:iron ABC transporter substrate-binding protein [Rhodovulum sulfidophilum]|uniref:Iron ABC transporter substrate-binding protein n=2 Tax=Rhodovulum visakhapatnamense TaxID=364297 RepID=A0ABS1RCG6_9RHOB|nr:iron ABC transporter substrate-binding protein [Rhodovulum visakhapatnamense]MBL3570646.1 iron ABC transporter substrate-binding protein [Rhodovulum visakhapatnamense]MBL3576960.1 iron ABC transporter substrate-binding protein [Rhodovulum visakhapatnamense]OLS42970.1 iron ABC transporter substrate-binding protein [Rhodovulum sulfidophilum]